ncbi:MAG TPA: glycosyltransferase [Terracidiphilus sp.]|nr:glycosyltransferase [Terracidiphilus sp.]
MSASAQPLVSIVTPVYNEEEYLAECVESILAQTYQNWEYTIVNNCSTDRTLEIARGYAAKDSRIRVHNNEKFLKMLANHNVAVRQISPESKYCKVVLGDDFIFPECLEKMVAVAEAHPTVGLVSAYEECGDQIRITGLPADQDFVDGREASRQFLMDKLLLFGSQNSVMYRSDLVRGRDPFYVETDSFADFESCFALLCQSDLGFVHQVLTFSRLRPQSAGAISSDIGSHYRSVLGLLFTYGHECLTREEFNERLDCNLSEYYRFLGRRFWVDRDSQFWSFHKTAFAELGMTLSRARLLRAAIAQLFSSFLQPKASMESFKRIFRLRRMRNSQIRRVALETSKDSVLNANTVEDGETLARSS